ncbi:MAG TPA: glycosyltransferase family 87 protein [Terriglobales bacterium]|nr:glycosyltransferase family 87 protein [Terriglobales bacterium]
MYPDSRTQFARIRGTLQQKPVLLLFLALFFLLAMWFYADRVWGPPIPIHFSDLYPRWYGAHELLLHHRDPYSPAVTREIQTWLHGAQNSYPGKNGEEDSFAYPAYLTFVLAPTVGFSFPMVQDIFRIVLPLAVAATVLFWISALGWNLTPVMRGALVLLTLGSFPVMECLYLQQPALLASLFLAGSAAALSRHRLTIAGALLALATIKPQFTVLFVPWLLLWAACDLSRLMPFLRSFFLTMAVLVGGSQLLAPGWIIKFLHGLHSYQNYTGNQSILSLWFGHFGAIITSTALVAPLAVVCWKSRSASVESARFVFTSCLVLTTTLIIIPTMYPTGQILLLPAVFSLLQNGPAVFSSRWQKLSRFGALSIISWPWIAAVACVLLAPVVPMEELRAHWLIPVGTFLVNPATMLLALATRIPSVLKGEAPSVLVSTEQSLAAVSK